MMLMLLIINNNNNNNYYYFFFFCNKNSFKKSCFLFNIALTESKMRKNQQTNTEQANKKNHTHLQENQQLIGLKANLPTEMVIGSWIVMSFVG